MEEHVLPPFLRHPPPQEWTGGGEEEPVGVEEVSFPGDQGDIMGVPVMLQIPDHILTRQAVVGSGQLHLSTIHLEVCN